MALSNPFWLHSWLTWIRLQTSWGPFWLVLHYGFKIIFHSHSQWCYYKLHLLSSPQTAIQIAVFIVLEKKCIISKSIIVFSSTAIVNKYLTLWNSSYFHFKWFVLLLLLILLFESGKGKKLIHTEVGFTHLCKPAESGPKHWKSLLT